MDWVHIRNSYQPEAASLGVGAVMVAITAGCMAVVVLVVVGGGQD